jgi:cation diffusion facilitator CzcD-associated flavoprotein CzcO
VIGGGVAGLQTVDMFKGIGIQCTIFEKNPDVGGVWRTNYAEFGLQVPWELFEFPGFRYQEDENSEKFLSGPKVQKYITRFAIERGIYPFCKFNTTVRRLTPQDYGWDVEYEGEQGLATEAFNYVVICTGMYSNPSMPSFPGQKDFKGEVMHTGSFKDGKQAEGKKIIVVGGGKSAIDCAFVASKYGTNSTLLFRSPHWPAARYLLNFIPLGWYSYSRFINSTLPRHYDMSFFKKIIHTLAAPLKWSFWRIAEQILKVQYNLSGDRIPKVPIEIDLFTGGQILNYDFRNALKVGKVTDKKGAIERYTEEGVILTDGTEIKADLVIFGTGFKKCYNYFNKEIQVKLNIEEDGLYLYRQMIPPHVPNLAFIGAETSTFNNILTQGLQTLWLRELFKNNMTLPSKEAMIQKLEEEKAWKRSWIPAISSRATIFQLHKMKYHDQLCKDMGIPHRRKGMNIIAEVFAPYSARDYEKLFEREPKISNMLA